LQLPLRRPDSPLTLAPTSEVSPAENLLSPAPKEPSASLARGEGTREAQDLQNLTPPPALPIAFSPIADELRPTSWKPAIPPPAAPAPKLRKYRLRDGDTLERLAERLLGDKSRAAEIFDANRHVLTRPDLLPVDVEILLPPRK
jgi:nucleoid-associated protein YgaU